MTDVLIRFLGVKPLNDHPLIYAGMLVVWMTLVINCLFSIQSLRASLAMRWFWFVFVVGVPLVGMLLYLLRCLWLADYSFLKFIVGPPRKAKASLAGRLAKPS